ncbi:hypothetical protein SD80_013915 [Scytonema tolypothrichoides VB-61278]|nr:hypothetical protein SD80_013915 [Scytonema tolypothrichoides VB-61278]
MLSDRVFPNPQDYFGYNCYYTGFVPIDQRSLNDGYLWVNHSKLYYSLPATRLPNLLLFFLRVFRV